VQRNRMGIALSILLAAGAVGGCGTNESGPLDGVDSIVFLQRPKRNQMGDIFQYTSYLATARIVKLSPPSADGQLTVLCCDQAGPDFANVDIASYDLSYDAKKIVFAGKLDSSQHYGLFVLTLDDGQVQQLPTDPNHDYTYPVFVPGDKIVFMSNAVVEDGAPQHRDEYERGETIQIGRINADGTGEELGPRNLSHRAFPTVLSDGRVMFTEWRHLGETNEGDLVIVNPDMTTVREGFGREGTGVTNSYLKAREIAPGRVIAIGTSRDRTIQSGALVDLRLGKTHTVDGQVWADQEMSEANASYHILTPNVPLDRTPSSPTVGRYYDAWPLNAKDNPDLLVSWADGPVESGTLGAAGLSADFGIYLYDSQHHARHPIFNDEAMWDVGPRPLAPREAPPQIASNGSNQFSDQAVLVGSMDVTRSTIFTLNKADIYGVRVMEGFSSEEGFPEMFGSTRQEGHAQLGIAPMRADGSWAGLIPANVPIHQQPIDKFGMALATEPLWISGRPGESRFCGGCHESRTDTTVIQPGVTQAIAFGPTDLMSSVPRTGRESTDYSRDGIIGVPWDKALQPIFDAKCVSCHDGTASAANPSYTITDPATGASATWTFNLKGDQVSLAVGDFLMDGYSASYLSLVGPDMEAIDKANVVISGDFKVYMNPLDARGSLLMQKLNPPQQFPTQDLNARAFPVADNPPHAVAVGNDLTPDEYYRLILAADMGANFYSRENKTGGYQP
jgi:Hydrazine synthase alpha subunit middle domain